MAELENFYNEHASQARQHEDHRERMTNIILSISGVLIGLITFTNLSIWSAIASISIIILGIYGFFFAGKHYERFKFHTSIMGAIRGEIDRLYLNPLANKRSLKELRKEGASNHYLTFKWPSFTREKSDIESPTKSWIAKQPMHIFWELVHILIIFIGLGLTIAILVKSMDSSPEKPMKIEIVK